MEYISLLPSNEWQQSTKKLCILGSTGSIGSSTLSVIRKNREGVEIVALAGGKNIRLLAEQSNEFRPAYIAIQNKEDRDTLWALLDTGYSPTIVYGEKGYAEVASLAEVNTVLSAQVGASGLRGTYSAVQAGKVVALANKESLVLAGDVLRSLARQSGASIIPVDSEHSAIFQAIQARPYQCIQKLILTASGGTFRGKTKKELEYVTPQEALKHPTWNMGAKITIDSATMMNKGLELIEAYHLFGVSVENISAVIHRQSIVHSLVEFTDASMLAQLSYPSMELAISYALYYPYGRSVAIPSLSISDIANLSFEPMGDIYECYTIALNSLRKKEGTPIVLNASNEIAVEAFLSSKIGFLDIARVVAFVVDTFCFTENIHTLEGIMHIDSTARIYTQEYIQSIV